MSTIDQLQNREMNTSWCWKGCDNQRTNIRTFNSIPLGVLLRHVAAAGSSQPITQPRQKGSLGHPFWSIVIRSNRIIPIMTHC
jgi:hypothetical protein